MTAPRGVRALALAAAFTVAGVGCERGFVQDPALARSVPVALELITSAGAGGAATAFDKADRIFIRVRAGERIRLEQVFPIEPQGTDLRIPVQVPTSGATETVTIEVELRLAQAPLFRGQTPLALRVGRPARATVALTPLVSGVAVPDSLPALSSYGDSVVLRGASVFATGDTIDLADIEWTSLDPAVVEVAGGVPIARGDGQARLVARVGEHTDTLRVRVFAVVRAIVVSPSPASLGLGESRRLTALLLDGRGNAIPDRPVVWTSSDSLIIRIAADGTATGVGVGMARITARSGGASSDALVEAAAAAPAATTGQPDQITLEAAQLHALVNPGGIPTDVWFQWAMEPTFATPFVTKTRTLTGGTAAAAVQEQLTGLLPNTTYFYRVIARNGAGTSTGAPLTFTTITGMPVAITANATAITTTTATLHGTVVSNGAGTAWFELGTSADPATFAQRASVALGASSTAIGIDDALTGLAPGTTYHFRLVAKTSAGTTAGTTYTFTTLSPTPVQLPPTVTTLAANPVRADSAVANALVNPNGAATEAWFEYDTDPQFSEYGSTPRQPIGAGTSEVAFQQLIQGLAPGATYYLRAAASNTAGTTRGAAVSFTTDTLPTLPEPPTVATDSSSAVAETSAAIFGTANASGFATQAWFEYTTDSDFESFSTTPAQDVGSGTADVLVSQSLASLVPDTKYFFRAVAGNAADTVYGAILSFTTAGPPEIPPSVFTDTPGSVGTAGALALGMVNPNGGATQAWFEYGIDPSLAAFTATAPTALGAGTTDVAVQEPLNGLSPGTTYYVRIVASNGGGEVEGGIEAFTTQSIPLVPVAPTVSTDSGGATGPASANLSGTTNPNGFATAAWFEYGTDPLLAGAASTPPGNAGAGTADVAFKHGVASLAPNTTYYFRAVAANVADTVFGEIRSFATQPDPAQLPPLVRTLAPDPPAIDRAVLNGRVNPRGGATIAWFEWGTDPTLATFQATTPVPRGSGTVEVGLERRILGLLPGTTYYARAAASNAGGTTRDIIISFTTSGTEQADAAADPTIGNVGTTRSP